MDSIQRINVQSFRQLNEALAQLGIAGLTLWCAGAELQ